MPIDVELISANVYGNEQKEDFTTYKLKVDCSRYGFYINGIKVILFHDSGQYKVYKPSTKDSYTKKFVSHIEFPNDSLLSHALTETCLRAVENKYGMTIVRNQNEIV